MSSRERVEDFSMSQNGIEILSTGRWVTFELITNSFEVRTTIDLVWADYGGSFCDCFARSRSSVVGNDAARVAIGT